ncbi:hypothetical protein ABZ942_04090 [Nocardia sp. NPDC046473]|uniref:hypothetical protein n=1 Tax=Nocardia sp. NPDC046473 TaxID=3155733 RepID=UPI0033E99FD2
MPTKILTSPGGNMHTLRATLTTAACGVIAAAGLVSFTSTAHAAEIWTYTCDTVEIAHSSQLPGLVIGKGSCQASNGAPEDEEEITKQFVLVGRKDNRKVNCTTARPKPGIPESGGPKNFGYVYGSGKKVRGEQCEVLKN